MMDNAADSPAAHGGSEQDLDAPAGTVDADAKDAQVAAAGATAADAEAESDAPMATDG